MATLRGLGLSKIIATGNEADIDVAECIDYLAEDPQTKVICAALESCRDGQRLRSALLKAAAAGKPVLVMKVGRTELGAAAASTHTGSLAGNDAVFDAVFQECGAYRPQSIEEMLDIAYYCTVTGRLPPNNALGIITGSGGIGVLMADHAGELNLTMPPLPPEGMAASKALLPFAVAANPLDMTAQVTSVPDGVPSTIEIMLAHGNYGTVFAYLAHVGLAPDRFASTIERLAELRRQYPHKDLVLVMLSVPASTEKLEAIGIPVFADPTRAMKAMGAAANMAAQRNRLYVMPTEKPVGTKLTEVSTEQGAKLALKLAGLPVLIEKVCSSAELASEFATEIGFPVVAKIASPDILHKTEMGGVLLNLQDAADVKAGFEKLMTRAQQHAPNAQIDGVLITPMVKGGVETILGVQVDPTFGPMILFGAGGTSVELFKDVALASAPLTPASASALMDKVKSTALLRGWRGSPVADEAAVVNALCRLSDFAMTHADQLQSVDINPLLVQQTGAVCLDAVISLQPCP